MGKEKKGPCFELAVLATFPKPLPPEVDWVKHVLRLDCRSWGAVGKELILRRKI